MPSHLPIQLVYFTGCSMLDRARDSLRRGLTLAGREAVWEELDQLAPGAPEAIRALPSPTILVGGRDITGATQVAAGSTGPSCRADGVPTPEAIAAAILSPE